MQHFDQKTLAKRWLISPRTLEQWRWQGRGPLFLKIGGHVVYRLSDIEAFESANLHANTVGPIDGGSAKRSTMASGEIIAQAFGGHDIGAGWMPRRPAAQDDASRACQFFGRFLSSTPKVRPPALHEWNPA